MTVQERIENFLLNMNISYETLDETTWLIEDDSNNIGNIIVKYEDPVVLFRIKVAHIPAKNREGFFKTLLELNATDMLYGAYGIEDDNVVITNTLAGENLDHNEFQSTVESITLAFMEHFKILQQFLKKGDE